jgi:hypothetical protein
MGNKSIELIINFNINSVTQIIKKAFNQLLYLWNISLMLSSDIIRMLGYVTGSKASNQNRKQRPLLFGNGKLT